MYLNHCAILNQKFLIFRTFFYFSNLLSLKQKNVPVYDEDYIWKVETKYVYVEEYHLMDQGWYFISKKYHFVEIFLLIYMGN